MEIKEVSNFLENSILQNMQRISLSPGVLLSGSIEATLIPPALSFYLDITSIQRSKSCKEHYQLMTPHALFHSYRREEQETEDHSHFTERETEVKRRVPLTSDPGCTCGDPGKQHWEERPVGIGPRESWAVTVGGQGTD